MEAERRDIREEVVAWFRDDGECVCSWCVVWESIDKLAPRSLGCGGDGAQSG